MLLPELGWALVLATVYWVEDLLNRSLLVDPGRSVPVNLGCNAGGLTLLFAAVFVGAFLVVGATWIATTLAPGSSALAEAAAWVALALLCVFRAVREVGTSRRRHAHRRLP